MIINASAGCGHPDELADQVGAKFAALGLKADITMARGGGEIVAAAGRALAARPAVIVAGGGDGTVNAVASVVVGSGIPFAVLPMGTLNHFAKDLGIPLDLDAAIRNVAEGKPRKVDVGEVNERVFLNNSSLGLYPDIVHDREKQRRRLGRGKWLAAFWATIAALRRFPFLDVRLRVNDAEHARRTPFVFIGNNEYTMAGLAIGERALLDGGKLSLYMAQHPHRLGLLRMALRAVLGQLKHQRDVYIQLAEEMEIVSHHTHMRVATDGEVNMMATPLRYRIRPGALTVITPL